MTNDLILDVQNLNTRFRSDNEITHVVKDVSLKLYRGHTLALVGESGCGKSVTVHSMVNLMPRNALLASDRISYYAMDAAGGVTEHRLDQMDRYGRRMRSLRGSEIGMVFQDPMSSLNPVMKVGSQVAENLRQHQRMSRAEARRAVIDLFRKLSIPNPEARYDSYPHQFSGGMRQRVGIAIAMICNPHLLIADEPTTALDVTIQAQIMQLMKHIQRTENKSIILITHNMGLVAQIADEVAIMYMGRIAEYGTLAQIFDNPSHPYTKALLRSVPVLGMAKGQLLEAIPGSTPSPSECVDGCEFYSRCAERMDECAHGTIPNREVEPGHLARCLLYASCREVE